ncbi:hypothetical protein DLAC_06318 [Tieghemostelium lacteum]|uniref:EGF-like domain-containing protein n=1 Tax=Tieghemostelium lacteum TaxID=361077 RepID=A0A151ZEJ8_TIELA|nr:hypothetical protein DLAC_06318 [Tieghemostelium lacteum]|eukprot:KYQ92355.1 hypothetical protein DLAC_06318 [Tieghemostelium lacteum]
MKNIIISYITIFLLIQSYSGALSTFNFDAWVERNHDNAHTSNSLSNPIINDMQWKFRDTLVNSTIYSNIIVLSDQSMIFVSSSNSTLITISKITFQGQPQWSQPIVLNTTITSTELIGNEYHGIILIYLFEIGQFQTISIENGDILWLSEKTFFNCSTPQIISYNFQGYSICQNGTNGKVSLYLYEFENTWTAIVPLDWLIYGDLQDDTVDLQSPVYDRELLAFIQTYNETFVHVDYKFNNTGLISMISIVDQDDISVWVPSYHNGISQYIVNQLNGVVVATDLETISLLVCVDGNSLYLDTYQPDGTPLYSQFLANDLNCSTVTQSKIGLLQDHTTVVVMFTILENNETISFLGLVSLSRLSMHWVIQNQQNHPLLDFVSTNQYSIYICQDSLLSLYNVTSRTTKTISYAPDTILMQCEMSVGENSISISSISTLGDIISMKAIDSVCLDLCPTNFTCGIGECICAPFYYPSSICDTFCNPSQTCSGNGVCSDDGSCICDPTTGYTGDTCSVCRKGYFGSNCNFHFDWTVVIIGGGLGFLATSAICIFACVTKPKNDKPSLFKRLKRKIFPKKKVAKRYNRTYNLLDNNENNNSDPILNTLPNQEINTSDDELNDNL